MSNIRLTQEDIESTIVSEEYRKMGRKTTVCLLTLKNGFEIIGTSGCVDPENFNEELGKKYAKEQAVDKIWELEGYLLQSKQMNTVVVNSAVSAEQIGEVLKKNPELIQNILKKSRELN